MDSDNSVKKLVAILEPLVYDLDDQKNALINKKEELENVSRFLAYTKDNYEMVGIYPEQDLITSKLSKIGIKNDEYKADCYLLKSDDDFVKKLPQYEKAEETIKSIVAYFSLYKSQLMMDIEKLSEKCKRKEIEKKYLSILSSPSPFVEDIEEFKEFINNYNLIKDEKIDIIIHIIKNNIMNYELKNK